MHKGALYFLKKFFYSKFKNACAKKLKQHARRTYLKPYNNKFKIPFLKFYQKLCSKLLSVLLIGDIKIAKNNCETQKPTPE